MSNNDDLKSHHISLCSTLNRGGSDCRACLSELAQVRLIRPQSSEVMQKRNEEAFADIQGMHVNVMADDLIIAARNETEHEAIMHQVLQCTRRKNVMVNAGNIQFKVTVPYMGNIVTKDGMRPDPEKIDAIIRIPEPIGKHVIVRLIGMISYAVVAIHPQ